jgi:hypothetical protein
VTGHSAGLKLQCSFSTVHITCITRVALRYTVVLLQLLSVVELYILIA